MLELDKKLNNKEIDLYDLYDSNCGKNKLVSMLASLEYKELYSINKLVKFYMEIELSMLKDKSKSKIDNINDYNNRITYDNKPETIIKDYNELKEEKKTMNNSIKDELLAVAYNRLHQSIKENKTASETVVNGENKPKTSNIVSIGKINNKVVNNNNNNNTIKYGITNINNKLTTYQLKELSFIINKQLNSLPLNDRRNKILYFNNKYSIKIVELNSNTSYVLPYNNKTYTKKPYVKKSYVKKPYVKKSNNNNDKLDILINQLSELVKTIKK